MMAKIYSKFALLAWLSNILKLKQPSYSLLDSLSYTGPDLPSSIYLTIVRISAVRAVILFCYPESHFRGIALLFAIQGVSLQDLFHTGKDDGKL